MGKRIKPKLADIKRIIRLYEDGIHSSAEAIINYTDYERVYVYRIIYHYRCNLKPLSDYSDFELKYLMKPINHIKGVYN